MIVTTSTRQNVITQVAEIECPEPGQLQACLTAMEQPVVIRGALKHWAAVAAASQSDAGLKNYLLRFDAGKPLLVYRTETAGQKTIGYNRDYSGFSFVPDYLPLRELINRLLNGPLASTPALYLGSTSVDQYLPGFRAENDLPFQGARPRISFWLGNDCRVPAHYDCPNNIACCVAGEREFTLFPPEQVGNLYIGPLDTTPSGRAISLVDFENPDFTRFPKFGEALKHAQQTMLMPGDLLYIPPLWWHRVHSRKRLNLLVNYWWSAAGDYRGNPDLALEQAVLALRGLPEPQKRAWRALFDHYIFSDPGQADDHIPDHLKGILDSSSENAIRRGWANFSKKLKS